MTNNQDCFVPGEIRLFFEVRGGDLRHFQALCMEDQSHLVDRVWRVIGAESCRGSGGDWSTVAVPVGPTGAPMIDETWIVNQMGRAADAVGLPKPNRGIPCMRYDAGAGHPAFPGEETPEEPPKPPHSCEACLVALDRPITVDGYRFELNWEFRVQFRLLSDPTPAGGIG